MKIFIVLFCFLLLGFSVFSLTLQIPKYSFSKGEELVVSGQCDASVIISGKHKQTEIFSKTVPCVNGAYSYREILSFLVPSGEMLVFAAENGSILSEKVLVKPTRESAFLTVSIFSPTARNIARTERITLSVSVLDANIPVESAVVKTWTPNNEPVLLSQTSAGLFATTMNIPFDAELGEWELVVLAEKEESGGLVGGEEFFPVFIVEAPVLLELKSPNKTNLSALEEILFSIKATYSDGSPINNGTATILLGEKELSLDFKGEGIFELSYTFPASDAELQQISIQATDSVGNQGILNRDFFVTGDIRVQFFGFLPVFIIVLALLVVAVWFLFPRIRAKKAFVSFKKRKNEIELELVSLQKDYFEKNMISQESFSKKSAALNKELEELNKKLNTLKSNDIEGK